MPKVAYFSVRAFLGRVLAAVVVGIATLLIMKPEPTTHWATPPAGVIRVARNVAGLAAQLRRSGLRIQLHVAPTGPG